MPEEPILIRRYPNRRFYARHTSKYVSLKEIEQIVKSGETVEIRDSQTDEDLTRAVLTRIIIDHQPDKMSLFPTDMLHSILRSNDMTSNFLRDYFRHSLTYLDYLQRHSTAAKTMARPMHWVKAWLDGITPDDAEIEAAKVEENDDKDVDSESTSPGEADLGEADLGEADLEDADLEEAPATVEATQLAQRVEQLEARIRQLEAGDSE